MKNIFILIAILILHLFLFQEIQAQNQTVYTSFTASGYLAPAPWNNLTQLSSGGIH